jgi:hypothetical protein
MEANLLLPLLLPLEVYQKTVGTWDLHLDQDFLLRGLEVINFDPDN